MFNKLVIAKTLDIMSSTNTVIKYNVVCSKVVINAIAKVDTPLFIAASVSCGVRLPQKGSTTNDICCLITVSLTTVW